jgi:DNA-binding NarL/FixJ family response regulator
VKAWKMRYHSCHSAQAAASSLARSFLRAGMKRISADTKSVRFSEPEKLVVILVSVGMTDVEIATRLKISRLALMERIQRVLGKIGARDRLEILFYGHSNTKIHEAICAWAGASKSNLAHAERAKDERVKIRRKAS